jgi:hypothetical protein
MWWSRKADLDSVTNHVYPEVNHFAHLHCSSNNHTNVRGLQCQDGDT